MEPKKENNSMMVQYIAIGVCCVIGILNLTRTQYITEYRACEIARAEVQNQLMPVKEDIASIKEGQKDIRSDVKELLKRVK